MKNIKMEIRRFVKERCWEKFHSPKNLSMSIAIEAAELMEHFQWLDTVDQAKKLLKDKTKRVEIEDELADIAIYLLDFCNLYGIDFEKIILNKLKKTEKRYPVKLVKGSIKKYTEYKK
ncbi:MAG: nucleotide pyrophosphohydrolase [Candidatus Omnitrophica bacterium]|nr:nucleotide pyrophosphohydrolase [Candidatus Omnitrophota bacterium]